jgi:hypothetical protein
MIEFDASAKPAVIEHRVKMVPLSVEVAHKLLKNGHGHHYGRRVCILKINEELRKSAMIFEDAESVWLVYRRPQ